MLPEERKQRILDYLADHEFAAVDSLVKAVNASPATIRRDLLELAERGVISRTRGGAALLLRSYGQEPPYLSRINENRAEKRQIAQVASSMVSEGETIALDVGSTSYEFARALRKCRHVTCFTASLPVAYVLTQSEMRVILVGGILRKMELSVAGAISAQVISQFHFDKFFMGAAGVSDKEGFTDFGIEDIQVKQAFIEHSKQVIVLADHTKLGRVSLATTCSLKGAHCLITDGKADANQVEVLRRAGLDVLVAGAMPTKS